MHSAVNMILRSLALDTDLSAWYHGNREQRRSGVSVWCLEATSASVFVTDWLLFTNMTNRLLRCCRLTSMLAI